MPQVLLSIYQSELQESSVSQPLLSLRRAGLPTKICYSHIDLLKALRGSQEVHQSAQDMCCRSVGEGLKTHPKTARGDMDEKWAE